jgi:AraC-like DNA-binding protein
MGVLRENMDIFTTNPSPHFFYVEQDAPLQVSAALTAYSLGIHETMPPGLIRRERPVFPYLFMHFHDKAFVHIDNEGLCRAAQATIIWEPNPALHLYGHESGRWCHSWLMLDGACVRDALASNTIPCNRLMRFDNNEAIFLKYARAIYDELHGHSPPDAIIMENLVQMWARESARALQLASGFPAVPKQLAAARRHMESHLDSPMRLADIAEHASMSVSRLSELFRTHYGMAPMHYLNDLRMKRATFLLADQNLAAYQVAAMVGFDDPLHFSKAFRKRWGVSPREYRKKQMVGR